MRRVCYVAATSTASVLECGSGWRVVSYQADRRQLSSVMLYGTPEKSSVDLFRMIRQKVTLQNRRRNSSPVRRTVFTTKLRRKTEFGKEKMHRRNYLHRGQEEEQSNDIA